MSEYKIDNLNPAITNWFNLLPSLKGKTVLIFDICNYHIFESLRRCGCHPIVCIDNEYKKTEFADVKVVESKDDLKEYEKFDICIMGQPDFSQSDDDFFKKRFECAYNALKSKGLFILGRPNTYFLKKNKRRFTQTLNTAGFKNVSSFICTPSFDEPLHIYPILEKKAVNKHIFNFFCEDFFQIKKIKRFISDCIKYFVFKTQGLINPSWGLLFVVSKNKDTDFKTVFEDFICSKQIELRHTFSNQPFFTIWHSKYFTGKYVGLTYTSEKKDKKLKFVIKKGNYHYHRNSIIQKEYDYLKLFSSHKSFFSQNKMCLPEPLHTYDNGDGMVMTVESAVSGEPLNKITVNRKLGVSKYKEILRGFIERQVLIQKYLSDNLIDKFPMVSNISFKNDHSIGFDYYENKSRIQEFRKYVQHGDYTAVNLYYDSLNCTFGIIDWEWLSAGFPPVFDLFHFFLSIQFLNKPAQRSDIITKYYNSFIETFFSSNWFSDFVKENILVYCKAFNIKNEKIYYYFMDFLLFLYNKYILHYNAPLFVELHKKMITYSIKNETKFIFYDLMGD